MFEYFAYKDRIEKGIRKGNILFYISVNYRIDFGLWAQIYRIDFCPQILEKKVIPSPQGTYYQNLCVRRKAICITPKGVNHFYPTTPGYKRGTVAFRYVISD